MDHASFEKLHPDDVQVIRISGVLDHAAAVQLRLALYGCLDADARRAVVDLSGVRLVDAGSINVLLAVHSGELFMRAVSPRLPVTRPRPGRRRRYGVR